MGLQRHAESSESREVRVLVVEDDEDDFLLTRDHLRGQDRTAFEIELASSFGAALERIGAAEHDVYLIDHRLGKRTGLELVREAFPEEGGPPVIMLTGFDDYEVDREASRLGVTDFLLKGELTPAVLERSIRYALRQHSVLTELRQTQERYALAVRGANDGIWDWDLVAEEVYFADRWKAALGYPDSGVGDSPAEWIDRVHPDDLEKLTHEIESHLAGETPYLASEHRVRHADGSYRWMFARGVAVRDREGKAIRMAGSISDITGRKRTEERLVYDALHDPLTGLPNRAMFLNHLDLSLRRARRAPDYRCAVLFLDLNRFKLINDAYSHAAGDQLLVALARRLVSSMRPGDTVARLGGDEFTILLDGVGDPADAKAVADRVHGLLDEPFVVEGRELVLTTAIGIAISGEDSDADELMRNADIAMYEVKRGGERSAKIFSAGMRRRVVSQLELETQLRAALDRKTLRVHYQPIVDLAGGEVVGLEALARWPADAGTPIPPSEFIPVAEATGMIGDLGRFVLGTALEDLADWRRRGVVGDPVSVSVNVSGSQLGNADLLGDVRAALAAEALPASVLRLEITENTIMQEPERMPLALDRLEQLGVGLHIDDFGTGYSSLTLVRHFAGRTLKIDRSFISAMGRDAGSEAIVQAIIALADSLDLAVIAEGVEDAIQLEALKAFGCRYGQGYVFARPAAAAEIEATLSSWRPFDAIELGQPEHAG